MKWQVLVAIAKNIGFLFSYDFWNAVMSDPDFPAKAVFKITFFAACSDILHILIKPGFPNKTAE